MDFITKIKERAKKDKRAIVLPESYEIRNLKAADAALKEGLADIILVGNKEKITSMVEKENIDIKETKIIEPDIFTSTDKYILDILLNKR